MTNRELGELSARLTAMEREMGDLRVDVRAIRDVLLQAEGGWRMLVVVGTVCSIFGSGLTWLLTWLPFPRG